MLALFNQLENWWQSPDLEYWSCGDDLDGELLWWTYMASAELLQRDIKMWSYQYRNSHCEWSHNSFIIIMRILMQEKIFYIYSLWPSDAKWCRGTLSTLVQVMACCLTTQSLYMNQCWLIISEALCPSPEGHFTGNMQDICQWYLLGANELNEALVLQYCNTVICWICITLLLVLSPWYQHISGPFH